MRIIGYPPLADAQKSGNGDVGISCGEHCDYGCLTFITADETRGALQVRSAAAEASTGYNYNYYYKLSNF